MQANPVFVTQYFDGTKQNVVPLFQRPYSWDRHHWKALWEDVVEILEKGGDRTHFLGAIVTLPAKSVPVGVSKHLVIDGQQRLTTLAILLCALRDAIEDDRLKGRIQDLIENSRYDDTDRLKLLPTQGDRDAYSTIALQRLLPTEQSRIKAAYSFFAGAIAGKMPSGTQVDPEAVFEALQSALQVVMISLADSDDPYLIFESLNYKGEPLSQSDLVRNYVLMRFRHGLGVGGSHDRIYSEYWHPMESLLGDQLEEFLRHYSMKDGAKIGRGGIYAAIKERMVELKEDAEIEEELDAMRRHAGYYAEFRGIKSESSAAMRFRLDGIREIGRGAAYPLLLRLFEDFHQQRLSESDLLSCLIAIESFMARRALCEIPTNTMQRVFVDLLRIVGGPDAATELMEALKSGWGSKRWPDDAELASALATKPLYQMNRKMSEITLRRIEGKFEEKEGANLENTTVEHVMPQTLTPAWKKDLGPEWEACHAERLHVLGNLTLTAYNSDLGNLPYEEKRKRFAISPIRMNAQIAESETWTRAEIETRGQRLGEMVRELWPR